MKALVAVLLVQFLLYVLLVLGFIIFPAAPIAIGVLSVLVVLDVLGALYLSALYVTSVRRLGGGAWRDWWLFAFLSLAAVEMTVGAMFIIYLVARRIVGLPALDATETAIVATLGLVLMQSVVPKKALLFYLNRRSNDDGTPPPTSGLRSLLPDAETLANGKQG